jgi:hypothetical protein
MKRYYISRVLGDGTALNPYYSELRAYIHGYNELSANWPNEPHFEQQVIAHVIPWCLMKYNLSQAAHDDVMATLTGIFSFPETGLDRTMSEISQAKRDAIQQKLEAIGFRFGWVTASATVRQILHYIAWSIQLAEWADVSISAVNHFDLDTEANEIPPAARQRILNNMDNLGVPNAWIVGNTTIREVVQKIHYHDDWSKRLFGTKVRRPWLFNDEEEF